MVFYYVLTFLIISYIFLKFPQILWSPLPNTLKKLRTEDDFWVVAHRGGSFEAPENTINAFRNAVEQGVDLLEMDCWMTKDGIIVVSHDNDLSRCCGVDKDITEMNYDELPPIQNRFKTHFYEEPLEFSGEFKIPRLEDVFIEFPGYPVLVELKIPTEEAAKSLQQVLTKYNRTKENSSIGAVKEPGATVCKRAFPQVDPFTPSAHIYKMFFAYFVGLLPFVPINHRYACIPVHTEQLEATQRGYLSPLGVFIFKYFCKYCIAVSKPFNAHLKKRGVKVLYWVLNQPKDWDYALQKGAGGIITDNPSGLIEHLNKKKIK